MPQNKQDEQLGNMQGVTYTETRFSKSPQKPRIAETAQRPVGASTEPLNYAELKFNRTSHLQHRKWFIREKRKGPGSPAWRAVTGVLGVLCVVLMTTVGVLLPNLFSSREEENREISSLPTVSSRDHECPCHLGSHGWIGFGNSYYHFFNESKTWPESRAACAALNAHLLKIDTRKERDVLALFEMEGWIGVKENEADGSWLWEDGTQVEHSLFAFYKKKSHSCAYMRGQYIYPYNCISGKNYICECNVS